MAALPLANRISQNSSRQLQQKTIVASYGDGVEQRAAIGINSRYDEWTVQWNNLTLTDRNTMMSFYATHGLVKAFTWSPPDGISGSYVFMEAPTETNNGLYYNFNVKIKQVFEVVT